MEPVAGEFQALRKGVRLHTNKRAVPLLYYAVILSAASDIPAARKACCLKGHTASRGSVKTGFNRSNRPMQSTLVYQRHAEKMKRTRTDKHEYFDAIRLSMIDSMHDLFKRTAKTMFKL